MPNKTLAIFEAAAGRPPATAYAQLDLRNTTIVLDFDDTTMEQTDFAGLVPSHYGGGDLEVAVTWAATSATAGDIVWQTEFERHSIGDPTHGTHDLDSDNFGTPATATTTAPSDAGQLVRTTISLAAASAGHPQAGESYRLRIARLAGDVADTLVGDAELVAVELQEV